MKTTFGQFVKRPRPKHHHGDLPSADRALVNAFNQGCEAGRSDAARRAPYMPTSEQAKHEAWLCGYDEVTPRYVASRDKPETRVA